MLETTFLLLTFVGEIIMTSLNDQRVLMEKYGIFCEQKTIYCYKKLRFNNFQDALNVAALEQDGSKEKYHDSDK